MGLSGFDPNLVNQSINSVQKAYNNLIQALGDDMQTKFIGGMEDKWACNDAQQFFNNNFKPSIDSLLSESTRIFESVVNTMGEAGEAWAEQTKSSYSAPGFSAIPKTMDTSTILENINGVRGVDAKSAKTVAKQLSDIAESANTALTSAQQAVQNCGFVGGSQEANLIDSLGQIKNNINTTTQELTSTVKNRIDATADAYKKTEGTIAAAFAGE